MVFRIHRCRWVRDRLPLLAGGELTGPDRRQVERHLITCAPCRDHERSLAEALSALQELAAAPGHEGPSLWPALRRQIREGKHAGRPLPLALSLPAPDPWAALESRRFRAAAALAAALAGLVATSAAVEVWVRREVSAARARELAAGRPIGPVTPVVATVTPPPPGPGLPEVEPSATAVARSDPAPTDPGRTASRFDYDLDRGTPMGDGGDIKASY